LAVKRKIKMNERIKKIWLLPFAFWLSILAIQGATKEIIKGKIIDTEGRPVRMAFVMVEGREIGQSVKDDGSFEIPDVDFSQDKFLLVSCEDYESDRVAIVPGQFLEVTLGRNFQYQVSVVAENSISSEEQKGAVVTKMDTYAIPGTAADPILAAAVLPGISSNPDTSNLLVRGGAPDETGYYYDGFEILHPFQMESSQANYFSVFDNQIVNKFDVVNSGFEPKFGNCLSGVLNIQSTDEINRSGGGLGISIMGLSGYYATPLGEKFGVILTGKRDFSGLLGRLNGFADVKYDNVNQMGNLIFKPSNYSKFKLSWLYNEYKYDQKDTYVSDSSNYFLAISFQNIWKEVLFSKIAIAYIDYQNRFDLPHEQFSEEFKDRAPQFRWDNVLDLKKIDLSFGIDFVRRKEIVALSFLTDPFQVSGARWGFYLNGQCKISGNLMAEAGARANLLRINERSVFSFDPRGSLALTLGLHHVLRFSAGMYSQYGDLFDHAKFPLQPKLSYHASFTYDFMSEKTHVRCSLFDKEYAQLFLNESPNLTTNNGKGYVRGFELYLVHETGHFKIIGLYNFLNSKRREGDILAWVDSSYATPHSGLLVVTAKIKQFQLSFRGSYATGLSYTPLMDSIQDVETGSFMPEYGTPNSARLPHFFRLDASLNKNFHLGNQLMVFYCGVLNVTDRKNIQEYRFNDDSGQLEATRSIFKRSFYLGFYIPFS
jgi:hypothetical protein